MNKLRHAVTSSLSPDECREVARCALGAAIICLGDNALGAHHDHTNPMPYGFKSDDWLVMGAKLGEVYRWVKTCDMVPMTPRAAVDTAQRDGAFQEFMAAYRLGGRRHV